MAKLIVTWLGEDDLHTTKMADEDGTEIVQEMPGPSFTFWGKTRFDKDRPVLVDSEKPGVSADERIVLNNIIARAPKNRFFKTEEPRQQERQSKG